MIVCFTYSYVFLNLLLQCLELGRLARHVFINFAASVLQAASKSSFALFLV